MASDLGLEILEKYDWKAYESLENGKTYLDPCEVQCKVLGNWSFWLCMDLNYFFSHDFLLWELRRMYLASCALS